MRPLVISSRLLERDRKRLALLYPEQQEWRPQTRGDCANVPRPCPYVGCRHHLYTDVNNVSGSLRMNYQRGPDEPRSKQSPEVEVWDLKHTGCSLDEADKGGLTLEQVAKIMGVTRERVRQIENHAMSLVKSSGLFAAWATNPDPIVPEHDDQVDDPAAELSDLPLK